MNDRERYIPFSRRTGLSALPPQLKLGEVPEDLRLRFDYHFDSEINREIRIDFGEWSFSSNMLQFAKDFHVYICRRPIREFCSIPIEFKEEICIFISERPIGDLFDFIEFAIRHPRISANLKQDIASSLEQTNSAYRVYEEQIVAIGNTEQAISFESAVISAERVNSLSTRAHLLASGVALRKADWPGSIRESIHAVESIVKQFTPGANKIDQALHILEKKGYLHGGLKQAFKSLYGYSSDEEGVRHALVFNDEAKVDETDALFMLGACASFVSYLIARKTQSPS